MNGRRKQEYREQQLILFPSPTCGRGIKGEGKNGNGINSEDNNIPDSGGNITLVQAEFTWPSPEIQFRNRRKI